MQRFDPPRRSALGWRPPAPPAGLCGFASSSVFGVVALVASSLAAAQSPPVPPAAAASAPAPGAAASVPAPAVRPPAAPLKPFDEVVAGATRIDGYFTLWQREDKVWLEIQPADLQRPFFLSPKLKTGLGDAGFYGGWMGDEMLVEFRRVHNQVQLIARNAEQFATAGTPAARAVEVASSASLVASTAVLSIHAERKSLLVDANALFVADVLGLAGQLQRKYRQGYAFDARNSAITQLRATPDLVVLEVLSHYAVGSISAPPASTPPVPDPRSLFMTVHHSLAKLPEAPMAPRKADARIGHFTTRIDDYSDDLARNPRRRLVQRWRLEKADPSAALSEPVRPIVFWLDATIPDKYREPIAAGVLEWNKAFEKIGFRDAVRVETQPPDAAFDTLDFGRASIRWMTNAAPTFGAVGPSHVDPRTGEILDADIAIESLSSRAMRSARWQVFGALPAVVAADEPRPGADRHDHRHGECDHADHAAEQLSYAIDVLAARGELDGSAPEVERFVRDYLKDVTMHEVGHALGLRHNFRSSRIRSEAELADPAFTARHSLAGSVMDYVAVNLPAPGVPAERRPAPFSTTIGPYDEWAIEYAYRPTPPGLSAAQEEDWLRAIADRSRDAQLAYGTDEDSYLGIDPESLPFDLGSDVIAFARKRVAIARDLLARQETRQLADGDDYSALRRSVNFALRDMGRVAGLLARQIGAVRTLRDHAGSGRDPLTPLPASRQRAALDLLATQFLAADSVRISPALQRKLAIDFQERGEALQRGERAMTDFSMAAQVGDLQRNVLAQLMSESVAARLLDSEAKSPGDALRLAELYERLDRVVWSELARRADIPSPRRELQREHMNRLAAALLRPAARADARSLLRSQAQSLLQRLRTASRDPAYAAASRAHLRDSADTLQRALEAQLQRGGA